MRWWPPLGGERHPEGRIAWGRRPLLSDDAGSAGHGRHDRKWHGHPGRSACPGRSLGLTPGTADNHALDYALRADPAHSAPAIAKAAAVALLRQRGTRVLLV